ncbi:MAG: hypothetical protein JWO82_2040 [Akkermansiaceae bacterium]|nr:hypothetical protein [Akkermansiaceae bacterium]
MKFLLPLLLSAGWLTAAETGVLDSVHDAQSYGKVMEAVPATARVWIAEPLNAAWNKWQIREQTGEVRAGLVTALKKASYGKAAGSLFSLDVTFKYAKDSGIGVMIVEYPGQKFIGFAAKPARENPKALRFATITGFHPGQDHLKMSDDMEHHGFDGVVMDREVKPIFLNLKQTESGR